MKKLHPIKSHEKWKQLGPPLWHCSLSSTEADFRRTAVKYGDWPIWFSDPIGPASLVDGTVVARSVAPMISLLHHHP